MSIDVLEFEKPIAEFDSKIRALRETGQGSGIDIAQQIKQLEKESEKLTKEIFAKLTPDQIVQVARHPARPHTVDYISGMFDDFVELHGDRHSCDGRAIIGGLARLNGQSVMVIGQEKGRETEDKVRHNFGMPQPSDYRKALRLMQLAERFNVPIITLIDTPGAYPGVEAEESNQSEAIARNIFVMSRLKTPIINLVIGEGCSGGALGIGVGDKTLMLQYSYYTVISPEGCASILWKSAEKKAVAAKAMCITAPELHKLKLIDDIVPEPNGSAHRDYQATMVAVKTRLVDVLKQLVGKPTDALLADRYQKLMLDDADLEALM